MMQYKETKDKINNKIKEIKDKTKEIITKNKKSFIILVIFYTIALIPLIRANFNYYDDAGRNFEGDIMGWADFSRWGNIFLSFFLYCGEQLNDISPLPLILSIFTLCIASLIVINTISDNKENSLLKVIAVIPLGISPYFLQCLSYKYDCLYMAISILVSVLPLMFYRKKILIYSIITIISTIFMCITYQASSGIFLIMVIVIALKLWNNNEKNTDIIKFVLSSIINYIIGILIFKFLIHKSRRGWVDTTIYDFSELLPGAIHNLKQYYKIIKNDFTELWKICILIISASFIVTSVVKSQKKKNYALIVSLIVLILTFILCFGVYIGFISLYTQPRGMYGFCVAIAILAVYAIDWKSNHVCKIACIILTYSFIIFSITYGNALDEQNRYADFRIQTLINDMNNSSLFNGTEKKILVLKGNIGKSPLVNRVNKKYKMLGKLVPSNLGESWYWDQYYFYYYFKLQNVVMRSMEVDKNTMTLVSENMYQNIYSKDRIVLVELK